MLLVNQDWQEIQEQRVLLDHLDKLVSRVLLAQVGQMDNQALKVKLVHLVLPEPQEILVHQDSQVLLDQMDNQELMDNQEQMVSLVSKALQGFLAQLGHQVVQE